MTAIVFQSAQLERVFEPSHIRRGRMATDPVWYVRCDDGRWFRFRRKRDAMAFLERCGCPDHAEAFCDCGGSEL